MSSIHSLGNLPFADLLFNYLAIHCNHDQPIVSHPSDMFTILSDWLIAKYGNLSGELLVLNSEEYICFNEYFQELHNSPKEK